MFLRQLPSQPASQFVGASSFGDSGESVNSSSFPTWLGCVFPGLVLCNDIVNSESVVGAKPGNSGVMITYKLMNLLTPGQQIVLLLSHKLTLGSWAWS